MKKNNLLILTILLLLIISACGKEDTSLENVKSNGVYTIAFFTDCEPFGFEDENGTSVGFDIDVHKEIAKRLGVTLNIQKVTPDTFTAAFENGAVQCMANGIYASDAILREGKPSATLINDESIIVVPADSELTRASELGDKSLAFASDTTAARAYDGDSTLKTTTRSIELKNEINVFNLMIPEKSTMLSTHADAAILSGAFVKYKQLTDGVTIKKFEKSLKKEAYAPVFREADKSLIKAVNKIIAEMKKDGTIAKISNKWFGEDLS